MFAIAMLPFLCRQWARLRAKPARVAAKSLLGRPWLRSKPEADRLAQTEAQARDAFARNHPLDCLAMFPSIAISPN
jgi:hypothetical protein